MNRIVIWLFLLMLRSRNAELTFNILKQRRSERNSKHLNTAADAEDRHPFIKGVLRHKQLRGIALFMNCTTGG